jgi:integrase
MIKYEESKRTYRVSYSRRHPITKKATSLTKTGVKTKEEAKRVYKELIIRMEQKFQRSTHPLWPEMVDKFLEHFRNRGVGNNTLFNYQTGLYAHTVRRWEKKKINEISTSEIRELILDGLANKSEALKKDILKYIRAVFSYASESGVIIGDPTPKLTFKNNLKIKRVLKEHEIHFLLKSAREKKHPWFLIWAVALYTGMRNGELYALKWDRVDLEKRIVVVNSAWNIKNGFKDTKSGDDRNVEIAESLVPLLRSLQQSRTSEFVLPRFEEWDKGDQARVLRSFLEEIDLPSIRFHDLRASWATVMLSKGVEPIKVMCMGGWKDLKTMQIYIQKSGINIFGITRDLNFLSGLILIVGLFQRS